MRLVFFFCRFLFSTVSLFSFFAYGADPVFYSRETDYDPEDYIFKTETELDKLHKQIEDYTRSLMLVFVNEQTPIINKMEILQELKSLAEISGLVVSALSQMSHKGIDYEESKNPNNIKDQKTSLWIKTQSELIRRKQQAFNELYEREKWLDREFYIKLTIDGIAITGGLLLLLIPADAQVTSLALFAGRIPLTVKRLKVLGAMIMATGSVEALADYYYHLEEEDQEVFRFATDLILNDILTKELFNILSSTNHRDRYLVVSLFSSSDEEMLIKGLLDAILRDEYSISAKQSAMKSLRGFPNMENSLKKEVISILKQIISDTESELSLRETAINVLGFLGKDIPEVTKYLRQIGSGEDIERSGEDIEISYNENLKLISLIQLGGDRKHFSFAINTLAGWLGGRNYRENPLNVQDLEIPKFFVGFLRELKVEGFGKGRIITGEVLKNHITVLIKLIDSGVLDFETALELSDILISWKLVDPKIEDFLKTIWTDPVEDIKVYIKELSQEILSEKNIEVFRFLEEKIRIIEAGDNHSIVTLNYWDAIIEDLELLYPNLPKKTKTAILERIKTVTNIYKKIWNP